MNQIVGIPRALMYHYYYPAWETFFQEIGMKVVLSPATNKKILDEGVNKTVDDLCLPFKVYFGHVMELLNRVDFLFIPRLISLGHNNMVCPKFMGLPDMIRASFNNLPVILEPAIDLRKKFFPLRRTIYRMGKELGIGLWQIDRAYRKGKKVQKKFERLEQLGFTAEESMALLKGKKQPVKEKNQIKVALLGHSYLLNDVYLSMDIIGQLKNMEIDVIIIENIKPELLEKAAGRQAKKSFWYYNRQVLGGGYYFLYHPDNPVQGIIQVTAFGCGPDSLIRELIDIRCRNKGLPVLNLNFDEHSGQAGLRTRLEAFVDLLKRKERIGRTVSV